MRPVCTLLGLPSQLTQALWLSSHCMITDASKSKLGKKTERRVTFAVRVCTATVDTGFAEKLHNAITFVQDFYPVSTSSGV
jgi:hypothetical protein